MKELAKLFLRYVGQTSPVPMGIPVKRAENIYLYTPEGKRYTDLISGVSVSNVGHANPQVIDAVCAQAHDYMHLMVYGEMIQTPQVVYARQIGRFLPPRVDCVYFVNSGSEAIEGALKLAKRYTGRTELVSFENAYHGSTQGALSMMGSEYYKTAFRPLLPDVRRLPFNDVEALQKITEHTAGVVIEPIQGEGGFRIPDIAFLQALRRRCDETGALLIFDEIQSGFGRTGKLLAGEDFGVAHDVVCMAKAMGGGMPLGGFAASYDVMNTLTFNPELGHITTFGGHPVCCAAGLAAMNYIIEQKLMEQVPIKSALFVKRLKQLPHVREIRAAGLMIAVDFGDTTIRNRVVERAVERGIVTEGFLFCNTAMRVAPPLIITEQQIEETCEVLMEAANF